MWSLDAQQHYYVMKLKKKKIGVETFSQNFEQISQIITKK